MHTLAASTMYYLSNTALLKLSVYSRLVGNNKETTMNKSYIYCPEDQGSIRLPCTTCAGV